MRGLPEEFRRRLVRPVGVVAARERKVDFSVRNLIHPHLKAVEARQKNKNLLRSRHAEVSMRPDLEIYSEDVKCSHGATVGELDPETLFYLMSRGFNETQASLLLEEAFLQSIENRGVRE